MRDAFGGTAMMYIMIIFLFVYTVFMAVALNYAKAFRVKNRIIDIIEQNEGIRNESNMEDVALNQIDDYLVKINYDMQIINNRDNIIGISEDLKDYTCSNGYCWKRISENSYDNYVNEYYKVVTFVKLEFPLIGWEPKFAILGETRKIMRINS